ncbi:hypothetical protein RHGRI_037483 [Rhododendron griersonianum]|uniref:F-box domain-containing protein n=1 Tax=Rhododendron griersonianum TaxID=479676 RepID=A0AAV6HW46_9ERIC|nr:hypothetical protein RHGRI_037483 [Rhododendron griersonianum]
MNNEGDYLDPEGEEEDEEEEDERKEEGIMMPPTKIPRTQNLDRISALHDSVLLHILSFLPMEDVVRAGALSRRWQFLWTSTSTLVFKRKAFDTTNDIHKFVAFVNSTLLLCRCSNIKKFVLHLSCDYGVSVPPDVNRWIRFATQNNVEDLDLNFGPDEADYTLPQHLFTNSSLRILSASSCEIGIAPNGQISLISLKSLTLDSVYLSDGAIEKILSGCPVLEIFNMKRVNAVSPLDINSASLKKLAIQQCLIGVGKYVVLEISAPNLQLLALVGNFQRCRFRLVNISSLVKANLCFSGDYCCDNHEKMRSQSLELLEKLEHVKELHLWPWCIQVLSVGDVKGLPSPMSSCKILTLHTHVMKWDVPGIASVLQSSPDLEKLVVDLSPLYHEFKFCRKFITSCNSDGKNPWSSCKRTYSPFTHLKTVEIVDFKDVDEETVLPLIQILLLNATVLEKMVIKIGKSGYKQCSECTFSMEFVRLTHKLLSFPRASPHAAILFA